MTFLVYFFGTNRGSKLYTVQDSADLFDALAERFDPTWRCVMFRYWHPPMLEDDKVEAPAHMCRPGWWIYGVERLEQLDEICGDAWSPDAMTDLDAALLNACKAVTEGDEAAVPQAVDMLLDRGDTLLDVLLLYRGTALDYLDGLPKAVLGRWLEMMGDERGKKLAGYEGPTHYLSPIDDSWRTNYFQGGWWAHTHYDIALRHLKRAVLALFPEVGYEYKPRESAGIIAGNVVYMYHTIQAPKWIPEESA